MGILDTSVKEFWLKDQSVPGIKVAPQDPGGDSLQLISPNEILRN